MALIVLLLIFPATAMAHGPYTEPLSGWLPYKGQEYQLQGWYGDGIVWTDPARVIVVQRDGTVVAVTGGGFSPQKLCASLDDCLVYLDNAPEGEGGGWRLQPEKMVKIEGLFLDGAPNLWQGKAFAFTPDDSSLLLKHPYLSAFACFFGFLALVIYGIVRLINRYLKKQGVF